MLAGEVLRFEGMSETEAFVTRARARDPIIPSYNSGKFPLSTHLAERVRAMLADAARLAAAAGARSRSGCALQQEQLGHPGARRGADRDLSPAAAATISSPTRSRDASRIRRSGMLLTRRLDRAGAQPLGFVANDYGMAVWGLGDVSAHVASGSLDLGQLFAEDMLGDDLDAWLAESNLMKRTFRQVALIAGLVERRHRGREKTGRQVAMSTNLIYDVLRRHDPHHMLLEAAWADAATGLLDIARLGDFLRRVEGRIRHQPLNGVSPLSVPILLEIGKEAVAGFAREDLLREAAVGRSIGEAATRGAAMLELKPERLDFDDFQDQTISDLRQGVPRRHVGRALLAGRGRADRRRPAPREGLGLRAHAASCCRPTTRARRCSAWPRSSTATTPATVIALGDSLHDVEACQRIGLEELEILQIMQEDREWIWVTGNHDPKIGERLGGTVTGDIEVEGIVLRHEPRAGPHHARDRRPPASGRALVRARLHDAAPLLRRQRPAPRPAGVRHLHRRASTSSSRRSSRCSATTACACGCWARKASTPSRRASSRRIERQRAQRRLAAEEGRGEQPRRARRGSTAIMP